MALLYELILAINTFMHSAEGWPNILQKCLTIIQQYE